MNKFFLKISSIVFTFLALFIVGTSFASEYKLAGTQNTQHHKILTTQSFSIINFSTQITHALTPEIFSINGLVAKKQLNKKSFINDIFIKKDIFNKAAIFTFSLYCLFYIFDNITFSLTPRAP